MPIVNDDHAILSALAELWVQVRQNYPRGLTIFRVGVTLYDLSPAGERNLDLLLNDDRIRRRWESANAAADRLSPSSHGGAGWLRAGSFHPHKSVPLHSLQAQVAARSSLRGDGAFHVKMVKDSCAFGLPKIR
ncbi:hypothetical protein [Mesorhizobium shangrilense]|uniref:Uncharacterized protein n=1 Tax=Mesorhizobium shangrilense TaxID=460060 RepID=A0ABV2DQ77_9HYPH